MFYLQILLGTLYVKVSRVKFSLLLLDPRTESLDYTTLIDAPP